MTLHEALNAIHDALPEAALAYTLYQSGFAASVHFVATDANHDLRDVTGIGCGIEDAWEDACRKLAAGEFDAALRAMPENKG